jgi:hypothetical protein
MSKIIGVIYPVPKEFVGRLLDQNRNVFVKYVRRTTNSRITPRNKMIIYASKGSKELVGEGVIQTIEFLTPSEALEKYEGRVFLDKDELLTYATQEPGRTLSKKMLVLVLSKLKEYSPHFKYKKPITMAGQYVTEEEYNELSKQLT